MGRVEKGTTPLLQGGESLHSSERIARPIKCVFDVLLPNSKSDTLSHTAVNTVI